LYGIYFEHIKGTKLFVRQNVFLSHNFDALRFQHSVNVHVLTTLETVLSPCNH